MAKHVHIHFAPRKRIGDQAPGSVPPSNLTPLVEALHAAIAARQGAAPTQDADFDESKVKRDEAGRFSAQQHEAAAAEHKAEAEKHDAAYKATNDPQHALARNAHQEAGVHHGVAAKHVQAQTGWSAHNAQQAHNATALAKQMSAKTAGSGNLEQLKATASDPSASIEQRAAAVAQLSKMEKMANEVAASPHAILQAAQPSQQPAAQPAAGGAAPQAQPAGDKPTSAKASGAKAATHELLSSGHPFSVDELMKATGCSNRTTLMTALSDLKNPKYAGKLGALNIVKRPDGMYHVQKDDGKPLGPVETPPPGYRPEGKPSTSSGPSTGQRDPAAKPIAHASATGQPFLPKVSAAKLPALGLNEHGNPADTGIGKPNRAEHKKQIAYHEEQAKTHPNMAMRGAHAEAADMHREGLQGGYGSKESAAAHEMSQTLAKYKPGPKIPAPPGTSSGPSTGQRDPGEKVEAAADPWSGFGSFLDKPKPAGRSKNPRGFNVPSPDPKAAAAPKRSIWGTPKPTLKLKDLQIRSGQNMDPNMAVKSGAGPSAPGTKTREQINHHQQREAHHRAEAAALEKLAKLNDNSKAHFKGDINTDEIFSKPMNVGMNFDLRDAAPDYDELGVEMEIDPSHLTPTQTGVDTGQVASLLKGDFKASSLPLVIRSATTGALFLQDGHHRAAGELLKGTGSMKVLVVDYKRRGGEDYFFKPTPTRAKTQEPTT